MQTRQGQLLIASGRLMDPNFLKTVVLIVDYDEDGVVGLVLNRPLEITVAEACESAVEAAEEVEAQVHYGGPCPGPLMVLHTSNIVGGDEVIPGIRYTAQREEIESAMRNGDGNVKYFAGYAGWSKDQLEGEIAEGAWLFAPATFGDVFARALEKQWSNLTTKLTLGQHIDPKIIPEDPSLN